MARLNISMNQPQEGETSIAAPPAGDNDVKLLKIQEEMDLLKTSIKKLLIDIRDRLNEKDNPFLRTGGFPERANMEAEDAPVEKEKEEKNYEEALPDEEKVPEPGEGAFPYPGRPSRRNSRTCSAGRGRCRPSPPSHPRRWGRSWLRKVHRLFGWTSKIINRYGHDRLESSSRPMRAWDTSPTRWPARSAR